MDYDGAVILISHDRHLIEATADRLWIVRGGTVKPYDGDMESYRALLLEERGARTSERKDDRGDSDAKATRTDQRRQAAERRAELAPLKKAMLSAEQRVEKLSKEIAALDVCWPIPRSMRPTRLALKMPHSSADRSASSLLTPRNPGSPRRMLTNRRPRTD